MEVSNDISSQAGDICEHFDLFEFHHHQGYNFTIWVLKFYVSKKPSTLVTRSSFVKSRGSFSSDAAYSSVLQQ